MPAGVTGALVFNALTLAMSNAQLVVDAIMNLAKSLGMPPEAVHWTLFIPRSAKSMAGAVKLDTSKG